MLFEPAFFDSHVQQIKRPLHSEKHSKSKLSYPLSCILNLQGWKTTLFVGFDGMAQNLQEKLRKVSPDFEQGVFYAHTKQTHHLPQGAGQMAR
jgi:hypothetical protein